MNVMFLDSIEPTVWGGMEEWIRLASNGLARCGHSVTVAGRRESAFLTRIARSVPAARLLPLDIGGDFHPRTIAAIKSELEQGRVDLLVVNFNKDVRLGGIAARFDGAVRVVWSVGLDITRDNWAHRFLTPKLIDGVITPSEALKQQITRAGYIGSDLVAVIPIGIDDLAPAPDHGHSRQTLRQRYGFNEHDLVGVTVGRLVEQKGHKYLIEAVAKADDQLKNARFLILGDGPLRESLDRLMTELGVRDRFVFGGMVDDVASQLPIADFMVHPSIEEPFGIALLEGMRAGLPIIASRVGGIPEVIDQSCAMLVPAKEPSALADALTDLSGDESKRRQMGQQGQRRFQELFTVDKFVSRLEQYLTAMLKPEHDHGQTQTT